MLRQSQALHATDKKEGVNATLNLVTDYDDDGIESDYEASLAIHYVSVARLLPFKCNSLLFSVLAKTNIIPDPDVEGLPLWAPNWNPPESAEYFLGPFRTAGDLPIYGTPLHGDMNTLHARGFQYAKVNRTLPATDNALRPLSVLSNLFISTRKSNKCRHSDIRKLTSTLTGSALTELRLGRDYFSEAEAVPVHRPFARLCFRHS